MHLNSSRLLLSVATVVVGGTLAVPSARADATACDEVAHGRGYADLIGALEADFNTTDQYQASYLISQAVNELCPALIWQLRSSAPITVRWRPDKAGRPIS